MAYNITRAPFVVLLLIALIGLGACDAPKRQADYKDAFALGVEEENISLALRGKVEREPLTVQARAGFERFVRTYHMRAKGPLALEVPANGMSEETRLLRITKIRKILVAAGIHSRAINVLPTGASVDNGAIAVLSFAANKVRVPECGNWESKTSFNWSNRRHSNFGCATQRNIGLTIANPGNLKAQETMGGFEGERGSAIVNGYRSPAAAAPAAAAPAQ